MDSFIKRGGEQKIVGAGADFQPSGLIGKWQAGLFWSFWTETDPGNLTADGMAPVAYRKMGRGYRVYFATQDQAKAAAQACGVTINPGQVWKFSCAKTDLWNVPEKDRDAFGDVVSFEVEVASLKSKKHGHKLQLVSLPGAVAAYAKYAGWKDVPAVDFADLLLAQRDDEGNEVDKYDDALYTRLCGNPDTKPDKNAHDSVYQSVYWAQRAALWAALGEPDAGKFHAKYVYNKDGSKAGPNADDKLATQSDKLDEALGVLLCGWETWARIVSVKDPKPDATYENASGETKRLTIPVVWEFFKSEADARKAAEDELKVREERKADKSGEAAKAGNGLSLPESWKGVTNTAEGDMAAFQQAIRDTAGQPLPKVLKVLAPMTAKEISDWREYLGV